MKVSKKCLMIVMAMALVGVLLCGSGCRKSDKASSTADDSIQLCIKCGQVKGGELCCKPNQVKCPKCGLVKGSPGCCSIPEGAKTAAVCAKCGQIKGSPLCCKPNQVKCPKCGLVKGSPGCCQIPKK